MTSVKFMQHVANWVNIVDLGVQFAGTIAYLLAVKSFELALYDGARSLHDESFQARLDRGLHSPTWQWLNFMPYLLLLTIFIHKTLFMLLSQRPTSRLDNAAFVVNSVGALVTMTWLTYWLVTSTLVQIADFLLDQGLGMAKQWLNVWIMAMVVMTAAMAICIATDCAYLAKVRSAPEFESEGDLAVPFLSESSV